MTEMASIPAGSLELGNGKLGVNNCRSRSRPMMAADTASTDLPVDNSHLLSSLSSIWCWLSTI